MAANYGQLTENLRRFYDLTSKVVLCVDAGGRQLLDPALRRKKLIAIDWDVEALEKLKMNVAAKSIQDSVDVVGAGSEDVTLSGDAVYLEFCLHETPSTDANCLHCGLPPNCQCGARHGLDGR